MLKNINKQTVIKWLFGLVLLSFIALGAVEYSSKSTKDNDAIVQVGKEKITTRDWRQYASSRIAEIKEMTQQQNISLEDLVEHGMIDQLLNAASQRQLLIAEAKRIGITVGDEMVKIYIASQPQFHDKDGKFVKEKLDELLQKININEKDFIKLIADEIASQILMESLSASFILPPQFETVNFKMQNIKKDIDIYQIDESKVRLDLTPSEEELQTTYQNNITNFKVPEKRDVSWLELNTSNINEAIRPITTDEIAAEYEQYKTEFITPEARILHFIDLPSLDSAAKFAEDMNKIKDFTKVSQKYDPKNTEGLKEQRVYINEAQGTALEPLFSLPEKAISVPIQLPGGGVRVYYIKSSEAPVQISLQEATPFIQAKLKGDRAVEAMQTQVNKMNQDVAGGISLADLAKKYNLKQKTESVQSGSWLASKDKTLRSLGEKIFAIEGNNEVTNGILVTARGESGAEENYFVYMVVTNITQEKQLEYAEVKTPVAELWLINKKSEELLNNAMKVADALKQSNVEALQAISSIYTATSIKNSTAQEIAEKFGKVGLNNQVALDALKADSGSVLGPIRTEQGNSDKNKVYIVLKVNKTIHTDATMQDPKAKPYRMQQSAVFGQYIESLRTKHKVQINRDAAINALR